MVDMLNQGVWPNARSCDQLQYCMSPILKKERALESNVDTVILTSSWKSETQENHKNAQIVMLYMVKVHLCPLLYIVGNFHILVKSDHFTEKTFAEC